MKLHGFSLIEALIALFIFAILMAMALPALKNFQDHTQDEIWQNTLLQAINMARFESQMRKLPVAICKSKDGNTCQGAWTDGWLVFIDINRDGVVHHREQILSVMTPPSHGSLFWRAFPSYRQYLLFSSMEFMSNDNGTFWHCHGEAPKWAIIISKSGRTRVAYPNENGVIKDGRGQPLLCDRGKVLN